MKHISKAESIDVFEDFSNSSFSSIKFSHQGSVYRFSPSPSGLLLINGFNLALFITPHLIYYFGHFSTNNEFNSIAYIACILLCALLIRLLVLFVPSLEIIIDSITKEIQLTPKDFVGKYIKKTIQIKIDNIAEINEQRFKTKRGEDVYLTLHTKDKLSFRLFALSNWDNVTKLKTAFTVLLFDKEGSYDDSQEPSVKVDTMFEKLLQEKESETSFLPMYVLIGLLLLLVAGLVLYFGFGKMRSYCAQVDSLWLLILKSWSIVLLVCAAPIYFAATTDYQKKRKATRKVIIVFGIMAMLGAYLGCNGLVSYLNIKMDTSTPISKQATVVDSYYTMGSKNKRSYYTLVVQIDSIPDKISIEHRNPDFHNNLKSTVPVSLYKGHFNKRWLEVDL